MASAGSPVKSNQPVSASVAGTCRVISADSFGFGSYNPTSSAAATTTGNLTIRCTKSVAYKITQNGGLNASAMIGPGGDSLAYGLYSDSAFSKVFGSSGYSGPTFTNGQWICFSSKSAYNIYGGQQMPPAVDQNNITAGVYASQYEYDVYSSYTGTATTQSGCQYSNGVQYNSGSVISGGTSYTLSGTHIYLPAPDHSITGTASTGLSNIVIPVYGKMAGSQNVRPGAYTDTVTFSVGF